MNDTPDHQEEPDGEDDVAGHLRMTDEQLSSGTTPSEAAAAAKQQQPQRRDADG
jgi:hypothetical protein